MTKSSLRADVGPSEITVLEFFGALQATETEAPFDDLRYLVEDEGLQLRTGYKGTIGDVPAYDVTVAIIKASRAKNIKEEKAMAEAEIDGKRVQYPLHGLYVKRSEVADIYKNLGESIYPWVGNGRDVVDKQTSTGEVITSVSRRDQQMSFIVKASIELGYDPLSIHYGGKAKIKEQCLANTGLFTSSAFEHAWKAAKKHDPQLVEVVNLENYKS